MLCACSGENLPFEDAPLSPESLATRDFNATLLSSKKLDLDSNSAENNVDDVESTLKEALSLNYEEARALLGRLEYQRGNFDAALRVFQGIDIRGLRPKMIKAISERTRSRKLPTRERNVVLNTISMHSVSLLLEAILLKSKTLESLGRIKDAAIECTTILDIMESALPHGMPLYNGEDSKLKEMFHKALELLPELWKQSGSLEEAVVAYRRALAKPWDLEPQRLASMQKDLTTLLLYGGIEASPTSNTEEAILLLLILIQKVEAQVITFDPEIMNHLTLALSFSGRYECLAGHIEKLFPGVYSRCERWYLLALCYSSADMDDVALNLVSKMLGPTEKRNDFFLLQAFLLGAKLCCKKSKYACKGIEFATRAIGLLNRGNKHFAGVANHLLGICYGYSARLSSASDSQRLALQTEALNLFRASRTLERDNPEVIYNLTVENAMQRDITTAMGNAAEYLATVAGSSPSSWRLLALLLSAEKKLNAAEEICDIAVNETGVDDQLEFLRLKAKLQVAQKQPTQAIETFKVIFSTIQAQKPNTWNPNNKINPARQRLEYESWLDLADIYRKLGSWDDSNICLERSKSFEHFSSKCWHATGAYDPHRLQGCYVRGKDPWGS